jgi:manganese transport protein
VCLIGFAVGLFLLSPDWGELARQATLDLSTGTEKVSTYWFYAVALFGAAMTPYECSSSPPVPLRRAGP